MTKKNILFNALAIIFIGYMPMGAHGSWYNRLWGTRLTETAQRAASSASNPFWGKFATGVPSAPEATPAPAQISVENPAPSFFTSFKDRLATSPFLHNLQERLHTLLSQVDTKLVTALSAAGALLGGWHIYRNYAQQKTEKATSSTPAPAPSSTEHRADGEEVIPEAEQSWPDWLREAKKLHKKNQSLPHSIPTEQEITQWLQDNIATCEKQEAFVQRFGKNIENPDEDNKPTTDQDNFQKIAQLYDKLDWQYIAKNIKADGMTIYSLGILNGLLMYNALACLERDLNERDSSQKVTCATDKLYTFESRYVGPRSGIGITERIYWYPYFTMLPGAPNNHFPQYSHLKNSVPDEFLAHARTDKKNYVADVVKREHISYNPGKVTLRRYGNDIIPVISSSTEITKMSSN